MGGSFATALLLWGLHCSALQYEKRSTPSVIKASTRRTTLSNPVAHDIHRHRSSKLRRRQDDDDTLDISVENDISLYFLDFELGTPGQKISGAIDTGSSDLWVNVASSDFCQERSCNEYGTFDTEGSSSYNVVNNLFNATYADGSTVAGPYATDTMKLGDVTLDNFQFGVGEQSTSLTGIIGIGYTLNEAIVAYGIDRQYANLPKALADGGFINTNAYSLWLNDLDANEGSILFGGVDTAKFEGSLYTMPVISIQGQYVAFYVALTGLGLDGEAGSLVSGQELAVLLDSGTTLTYLPTEIVEALYRRYNAVFNEQLGGARVDCSLARQEGSLDFSFSDLTISVKLSELIINVAYNPSVEACLLGVAPSSLVGSVILGDTFLRSAYVVYDLTNNEISMAATKFNVQDENIQEIQADGELPSATVVSDPITSASDAATGLGGDALETGVDGNGATTTDGGNSAVVQTAAPMLKYGGVLAGGVAAAMALL